MRFTPLQAREKGKELIAEGVRWGPMLLPPRHGEDKSSDTLGSCLSDVQAQLKQCLILHSENGLLGEIIRMKGEILQEAGALEGIIDLIDEWRDALLRCIEDLQERYSWNESRYIDPEQREIMEDLQEKLFLMTTLQGLETNFMKIAQNLEGKIYCLFIGDKLEENFVHDVVQSHNHFRALFAQDKIVMDYMRQI